MGNEPFDERFMAEALRKAASPRAGSPVKAALLDQAVVAGVGNIYSDEALFRAGIRPGRLVADLAPADWQRLRDSIVAVLTEAIDGGGTVSDNFFNTEGQPGLYVPQVYARNGLPCVKCSAPLVRTKITGRGTVYCPNCQS
jgi:formamidopyrimidine-DNA glycosylase